MSRQCAWLSPGVSLVIACFFWAAGTVISKQLLNTVPPVLFLVLQLAPSAAALWLFTLGRRIPLPRGVTLLWILVLGWLNPGLSYTLSMFGLVHASASVASLMWAAEPIFIVVLAWWFLREQISLPTIMLTTAATCGVYLASGIGAEMVSLDAQATGAALILCGVLCCAVYTVASRRIATDIDPVAIIAIQQSVGLCWALCLLPFEPPGPGRSQLTDLTMPELLGGVFSGLMYYALAFWFYLVGLRSMTASRTGSFFNLIPVFGIGMAFMFLGERLSVTQWIGAATILISVSWLQALFARRRDAVT